jgi:hypothetical protein
MFKRGNWAIMGVELSSLKEFQNSLQIPEILFDNSQLAAGIRSKFQQQNTVGINPFASPRKDEKLADALVIGNIDAFLQMDKEGQADNPLDLEKLSDYAGLDEYEYRLGMREFYAFWVVINTWGDVTDLNSKKEAISYEQAQRPYQFMVGDDKKAIDKTVDAMNVVQRRQYPVLVDFEKGHIYVETVAVRELSEIQVVFRKLGLEITGLRWDFGSNDWADKFLNYVEKNTKFRDEFQRRAEEMGRFTKQEVEKLEDKMLERIVTNFYAMAELPTGTWAGLGGPAKVKLHASSEPITVQAVTNATVLLSVGNEAKVIASPVVFQSLEIRTAKNGDEHTFRSDLLRVDLNDNMVDTETGSAIMRGLDLPGFKRNLLYRMKKEKAVFSITEFWEKWLIELREAVYTFTDSVVNTLELERGDWGLSGYDPSGSYEFDNPEGTDGI